jgi:hypothetical protein
VAEGAGVWALDMCMAHGVGISLKPTSRLRSKEGWREMKSPKGPGSRAA